MILLSGLFERGVSGLVQAAMLVYDGFDLAQRGPCFFHGLMITRLWARWDQDVGSVDAGQGVETDLDELQRCVQFLQFVHDRCSVTLRGHPSSLSQGEFPIIHHRLTPLGFRLQAACPTYIDSSKPPPAARTGLFFP